MAPPKGFRPAKPFAKGNPGRPVGSKNKVAQSVREAFLAAFQARGGAERLIQFADASPENEREFYRLASKLIPTEIAGDGGGALLVRVLRGATPEPEEPSNG